MLTDGDATSDIDAVRGMAAIWRNGRLVDRAAQLIHFVYPLMHRVFDYLQLALLRTAE